LAAIDVYQDAIANKHAQQNYFGRYVGRSGYNAEVDQIAPTIILTSIRRKAVPRVGTSPNHSLKKNQTLMLKPCCCAQNLSGNLS
jgi:hypothetical protein